MFGATWSGKTINRREADKSWCLCVECVIKTACSLNLLFIHLPKHIESFYTACRWPQIRQKGNQEKIQSKKLGKHLVQTQAPLWNLLLISQQSDLLMSWKAASEWFRFLSFHLLVCKLLLSDSHFAENPLKDPIIPHLFFCFKNLLVSQFSMTT